MDQEKYDELLVHFLRYKPEDDAQLWLVIDYVSEALGIDAKKMTIAQGEALWAAISKLIAMMLQSGFIAFSFGAQGVRIPWPEQDPKQVMTRIRNKWIEYKGKFPDVGFIVWFHNGN